MPVKQRCTHKLLHSTQFVPFGSMRHTPVSAPSQTGRHLQQQLSICCRYLQDNSTRQNTTMVENSLQYYVSALIENINSSSVSTTFAGQNSTDNNSTLVGGISSYDECASNTQGSTGGGFLSRVTGAVSSFVGSAVCEVSSSVNDLVQEVDAARGYLDDSARETPGQRNASFTSVDVRRPFHVILLAQSCSTGCCMQTKCLQASLIKHCCICLPCPALPCPALSSHESSAQNQYKLLVRMTCCCAMPLHYFAAVPDACFDPAAVLKL